MPDTDGARVGKAALNLALAQIAQGQWDVARTTLAEHAEAIPARDRGLALALAGDPNGGVALLIAAARTPDADARTRQNLALALALSGRAAVARRATQMTIRCRTSASASAAATYTMLDSQPGRSCSQPRAVLIPSAIAPLEYPWSGA